MRACVYMSAHYLSSCLVIASDGQSNLRVRTLGLSDMLIRARGVHVRVSLVAQLGCHCALLSTQISPLAEYGSRPSLACALTFVRHSQARSWLYVHNPHNVAILTESPLTSACVA